MNTIKASQFDENEILLKMYGVIVAHHEVPEDVAQKLVQHARLGTQGYMVRETYASQFGENTDNPMYLSYECDMWVEPEYDPDTFIDEVGAQNAIPFIMVINHITFYEDKYEMQNHMKQLQLEAMAGNAKFNYLTHNN